MSVSKFARVQGALAPWGFNGATMAEALRFCQTTDAGNARDLFTSSSAKTNKSEAYGYLNAVLYLAPADRAGLGFTVCPDAGACRGPCLQDTGRMRFAEAHRARTLRTVWWYIDRPGFVKRLTFEIDRLHAKAHRLGLRLVVRLDGTSDLPWHRWLDMGRWAQGLAMREVWFNDYTKGKIDPDLPANYRKIYSLSEGEASARYAFETLRKGGTVAVVVSGKSGKLADARKVQARILARGVLWGFPVVDGDAHDVRMIDPEGAIVVLHAKGGALKDQSGFVKREIVGGCGPEIPRGFGAHWTADHWTADLVQIAG